MPTTPATGTMNVRFVACASHAVADDAVWMVTILLDRAAVGSTRDALRMHARTVGVPAVRFEDLYPADRAASIAFFGAMRVLGGVAACTVRRDGEAVAAARARLLGAAARHAADQAAGHMVIDDSLGDAEADAAVVADAGASGLTTSRAAPDDEPLLWIPAGVAYLVAHTNPSLDEVPGWLHAGAVVVDAD